MNIITANEIPNSLRIAIVVSRFNEEVTRRLLEGALARLKELEISDKHIDVAWVPGAIELGIAAQRFAEQEHYHAIICFGCVIQGETRHFDYVCEQASSGCQSVALSYSIPVIFGVLTTEDEAQALDRVGGRHGHKGRDAVDAACEMVSVLHQIDQLSADVAHTHKHKHGAHAGCC